MTQENMSALTVWKFDNPEGAEKAAKQLKRAAKDGLLTIVDLAVLSWPEGEETPDLQHVRDSRRKGAGWGALWGVLGGALFLVPVLGAAVGAGVGALAKATDGTGITQEDLERIRLEIVPGTSGLFLVTQDADLDRLGERITLHNSNVISINLSPAAESLTKETLEAPDSPAAPEPSSSAWIFARIEHTTEGRITGTVVCAAAIAWSAEHTDTTAQLSLTIFSTVLVYWLAHFHALTIGHAMAYRHHPVIAARRALRDSAPILGVSIVPLVALLVLNLFGVDLRTAAWAALFLSIGLLALYSYLAGLRSGMELAGRIVFAAAGAALGVIVATLKVALH